MADLIIEYGQRVTPRGPAHVLFAAHPDLDPGLARDGVSYVHCGADSVSEPVAIDGHLFACLIAAMWKSDRLVVRGAVTERALRHAHLIQDYWSAHIPMAYRRVDIEVDRILSDDEVRTAAVARGGRRTIAAYSGGIDSTEMVLRRVEDRFGTGRDLTDVVMVHGFDVDPADDAGFGRLVERVRPLLDDAGLALHVVWTDARRLWAYQEWDYSFGLQFACILHQFADRFDAGLLAAGRKYDGPNYPFGSNAMTDPLMSGGLFDLVHDGAGRNRTEKIGRLLARPTAIRALRFCWQGPDPGRNCGACEKCVRTRLAFSNHGVDWPECFDTPFDAEMIDSIEVHSVQHLGALRYVADAAAERPEPPAWLGRIRSRITELERRLADAATA